MAPLGAPFAFGPQSTVLRRCYAGKQTGSNNSNDRLPQVSRNGGCTAKTREGPKPAQTRRSLSSSRASNNAQEGREASFAALCLENEEGWPSDLPMM